MDLEGDKNRKPCKPWAHTRASRGMFERCGRCRWRARHQTGMAPHRGLSGHCIRFVFFCFFCFICFFLSLIFFSWGMSMTQNMLGCDSVSRITCSWICWLQGFYSRDQTKVSSSPIQSSLWSLGSGDGLYPQRPNHHICHANDTLQNRHLTECKLQMNSC